MAEKRASPTLSNPATSLQRGKACLRCRKRKMRCDGVKPSCQQCVRAKKADCCEYDDGKGKTRTQLMREHIARLESRIKELERPEVATPPVTLFDPHSASPYFSSSSPSSSHGSPGNYAISASASPPPFPLDVDSTHWGTRWEGVHDYPAVPQSNDPYGPEDPPLELAHMLLEIFLPHRHQCGLEVHVGRLRESLTLPPSEQRHPMLMNAIYLWACFLSRPGSLCDHEPLYLARALAAVNDAMSNPSKVIDFIQASCLLSVYFLANGRLLEGSYHASAAASLAMQWGLHQIGRDEYAGPIVSDRESTFRLEPAKDTIEQGERILAFWQVFNLDRCWSVALQRPATIPDSKHPWTVITTPWPQNMEDYETGDLEPCSGSPTVHTFFIHQAQVSNVVGGFSTFALHAKAAALFEGASRLSSSWAPHTSTPPSMSDSFQAFQRTISRFASTLIPLHQLAATMPHEKQSLIMIHSLAHAAMIRLHEPFLDDRVSRDIAVRAARAVAVVAKHISDGDFEFLDPLIGHCWLVAARVLITELAQLQAAWPPPNTADIRSELSTLLYSMTKLSSRFPLLGYQATKVQKLLDAV